MKRLGVLGWPVAHSRSPAMQRAALAALGLNDYSYQLLPVPPEVFDETVASLGAAGFVGANVTIPHKEAALALASDATDRARAIGAANTLSFGAEGSINADNTDAPGFIEALGFDPSGARAVVLGAGGSARAIAWALRDAGAADVAVHNRTPERAQELAAAIGVRAVAEVPEGDLLINCTSIGLSDESASLKELPLTADALGSFRCVVDMVYREGDTALIAAARANGQAVVDGLEILVRQGALSFEIWTGKKPPLQLMRDAARAPADRRNESRLPTPEAGSGVKGSDRHG